MQWIKRVLIKLGLKKMEMLKIISVFKSEEPIPERYTFSGKNVNPPLLIDNIPQETKTLAVIVDDTDSPSGLWTHWTVFDIPITEKTSSLEIKENLIPGVQGINDFKQIRYRGPSPPSGTHRYHFRVFALDSKLGLDEGVARDELERFMKGHIIGKGVLVGKFSKT